MGSIPPSRFVVLMHYRTDDACSAARTSRTLPSCVVGPTELAIHQDEGYDVQTP